MNGEAVKELATRLQHPEAIGDLLVVPKDWTALDPVALIKSPPMPHTLDVSTLGAVRDYLVANRDSLDLKTLIVHVEDPQTVRVRGPLEPRAQGRPAYLVATADDLCAEFLGRYMALKDFIVGLQIRFVDADDRRNVLGLLSNVKDESVKSALDDGMTQVVQARAGVALVSDVAVPNPVLLAGFRTFRDVVHPSALYVLRVQAGRTGGLPEVGLYEADGGAWELQAIARVRDWLKAELPPEVAILA